MTAHATELGQKLGEAVTYRTNAGADTQVRALVRSEPVDSPEGYRGAPQFRHVVVLAKAEVPDPRQGDRIIRGSDAFTLEQPKSDSSDVFRWYVRKV